MPIQVLTPVAIRNPPDFNRSADGMISVGIDRDWGGAIIKTDFRAIDKLIDRVTVWQEVDGEARPVRGFDAVDPYEDQIYGYDWEAPLGKPVSWYLEYFTTKTERVNVVSTTTTYRTVYQPKAIQRYYDPTLVQAQFLRARNLNELADFWNLTIGQVYGVNIQIMKTSGSDSYSYSGLSENQLVGARKVVRGVAEAISYYPPSMILGTTLDSIRLIGAHPTYSGWAFPDRTYLVAGGFNDTTEDDEVDYQEKYGSWLWHHEQAHVLTYAYDDYWLPGVYPNDARTDWLAQNPPGFVYGQTSPALGFASPYGQTNYWEDVAEVVAGMWDPYFTFHKRLKSDPLLRGKTQIVVNFMISKGMTNMTNFVADAVNGDTVIPVTNTTISSEMRVTKNRSFSRSVTRIIPEPEATPSDPGLWIKNLSAPYKSLQAQINSWPDESHSLQEDVEEVWGRRWPIGGIGEVSSMEVDVKVLTHTADDLVQLRRMLKTPGVYLLQPASKFHHDPMYVLVKSWNMSQAVGRMSTPARITTLKVKEVARPTTVGSKTVWPRKTYGDTLAANKTYSISLNRTYYQELVEGR